MTAPACGCAFVCEQEAAGEPRREGCPVEVAIGPAVAQLAALRAGAEAAGVQLVGAVQPAMVEVCRCEHSDHFDGGPGHPYGAALPPDVAGITCREVGPVCPECAGGHYAAMVVRLCAEGCGLAAADGDVYCDGCRSGIEAGR